MNNVFKNAAVFSLDHASLQIAVVKGKLTQGALLATMGLMLVNCGSGQKDATLFNLGKSAADVVSLIAIGDAGTGNNDQLNVANAMRSWCRHTDVECDFALYLGDNFYDSGIPDEKDDAERIWMERFGQPYFGLDFPFYVVMGNHDYSWNGIGKPNWNKVDNYTQFHQRSAPGDSFSERWQFPSPWYHFAAGNAMFTAIDTENLIYGRNLSQQQLEVKSALESAAKEQLDFNILFGHHPIYSNGAHGNAGSYGKGLAKALEQRDGKDLWNFYNTKTLNNKKMCDSVDIYINGHDHNQQVINHDQACAGLYIVSGTGGKVSKLEKTTIADQVPETLWASSELGFAHITISGSKVLIRMVNDHAIETARIECYKNADASKKLDCTNISLATPVL